MSNPKTIYCPRCGRKIMNYGGMGTMPLMSKCHKCNKIVKYLPEEDKTIIRDIPPRNTSSGMTFY